MLKEQTAGGPFYNPFGGVRVDIGGHRFHIACARGYKVGGAVATEQNGIFVVHHATHTIVFDRHLAQPGCWVDTPANWAKVTREIERIAKLSAEEFSMMIDASIRKRFNPFAEAKARAATSELDKKLRKAYAASFFDDNECMSSNNQRTLVHAWEMFLVAALHTDEASYLFKKFRPCIYNFLVLYGGYIAHSSRSGFFHDKVSNGKSRRALISCIAKGRTSLGRDITQWRPELTRVVGVLSEITQKYLA